MPKTPRTVAEVLAFLASLYPRYTLTTETIDAYLVVLEDVPIEILRTAALDWGSRSQWFPTAAELRQAAFDLHEVGAGVPTAAEALAEVVRQIRKVGYYGQPQFSHPVVHEAVRAVGGWGYLCLSENWMADRARFLECYQGMERRHKYTTRMLPQVRDMVQQLADSMKPPYLEEPNVPRLPPIYEDDTP